MRKHVARTFSALLLATGAALTASACREAETEAASAAAPVAEHRVDVPALTVSAMDLESTLQISGNLIPQERVAIFAKLPGTISRVAVNIGDRVRTGQPVAVMDRREIDAQVDAATASINVATAGLESAEAGLANAVLEHERAQKLFDSGAIARQNLDAAQTTRRSANAQRDLARANVAQAEAALRRAREELNRKRNGSAVPALAPEGVPTDQAGDDLTRIKGIGRKMQERLNALGIRTLSQLAALTPEEVARIDAAIEFPGRVERERWVEQAKALLRG